MRAGFAALLFVAVSANAHPGVGIVVDSRGNVFYTDLKQVWRIAPDGEKTVAVPNVHTHELYVDSGDNLYGEHLWYNGERLDTWGSRVWRRTPDGRVVDIVPAHPGFNDTYSFVRDRAGTMYWAAREKNEIQKRTPDGHIVTVARHNFRDVRWMTVTPDGTVYLIDRVDLLRVTPDGRVATVARNVSAGSGRHAVMGLWLDRQRNVYAADYSGSKVKRIDPNGRVEVVARSLFPWGPTGGVFDRSGNLWLLEYNILNQARARKITVPARTSGLASTGR
jgi:sugar lactone lactonase YvrE